MKEFWKMNRGTNWLLIFWTALLQLAAGTWDNHHVSSCPPQYDYEVDPELYVCKCVDNETPSAVCNGKNLDTIPNDLDPALYSLDVSYNQILVLSHLGYYEFLHNLEITHNNLTVIEDHCFSENHELEYLDLSYNMISAITSSSFFGVSKLVKLNLSNNKISTIENAAFKQLEQIFSIDLSNNALHQLGDQVFSGSVGNSLIVLNLAHNHLESVPREALSKLSSLSTLNLEQNQLRTLEDNTFMHMQTLTTLSLRECGLYILGNEVFSGLRHLDTLDISHNMFQKIPDKSFYYLSSLETLHIGGNSIRSLGRNNLCNLRSLKHFSMRDCKEDSLDLLDGAFEENLELVTIDLSKCHIHSIDSSVRLDHLTMLKELNFHGNFLTTLDQSLLPFSDLRVLDLSDCPLECDCSTSWMKDLADTNADLLSSARCYYNDEYNKIVDTDPEAFSCTKSEGLSAGGIVGIVIAIGIIIIGILLLLMWWKNMLPCTNKPKENYFLKHRNGKTTYSSSRKSIEVIQHKIEDKNGKFIDLPGFDQQDVGPEEEEPMYQEVCDDTVAIGPDVKTTVL